MTPLILRILLIVLAVWLLRRFLTLFLRDKRTAAPRRSPSPGGNMVKDPVCGMYMDPRLALKYETKNGIFYFCSEECKSRFLQPAPGGKPGEPPPEN